MTKINISLAVQVHWSVTMLLFQSDSMDGFALVAKHKHLFVRYTHLTALLYTMFFNKEQKNLVPS
ncbi:hypothetical protein BCV73_17015 [Paenibacillus sp. SSG-1]|nr:hypothetical protein BCV73_17015 [Paenibacillus sp. SSG-1]